MDKNHRQVTAITAICVERFFQDQKYGKIDAGGGHTLGEWLLVLERELAEAKEALIKGGTGRDEIMSEIIQIAAVALAAIEQYGVGPVKITGFINSSKGD